MPYTASVYNVLIASPGDVQEERQVVREAIEDWNRAHAKSNESVLVPLGWELDSMPEMGQDPQGVINEQLVIEADFIIAVFWTRLGTPTARFSSGTVEEIEKLISAKRPVMIYFSNKPSNISQIDTSQLERLNTWRRDCEKRGLTFPFSSKEELRRLLGVHIPQRMNSLTKGLDKKNDFVQVFENVLKTAPSDLDPDALKLLKSAAETKYGTIVVVRSSEGLFVKTAEKEFVGDHSPRTEAKWYEVIKRLKELSMIHDTSGNGTVYELTNDGFRVVDQMKS
jgi:hypothetical protein